MSDDRMAPLIDDNLYVGGLFRFVNPSGHEADLLGARLGMLETVRTAYGTTRTKVHVIDLGQGADVGHWASTSGLGDNVVVTVDDSGTAMAVGMTPPEFPNGVEFSRVSTDTESWLFWTAYNSLGGADMWLMYSHYDTYSGWTVPTDVPFRDGQSRYLTNAMYSTVLDHRILFYVKSNPGGTWQDPYNAEAFWCALEADGTLVGEWEADWLFDPQFLPLSAPVRPCNDAYAAYICDYVDPRIPVAGTSDLRLRWYELRTEDSYVLPQADRSTELFRYPNVTRSNLLTPAANDTVLVGQGLRRAPAWDPGPGVMAYVAYVLLTAPDGQGGRASYVDCFEVHYAPTAGAVSGSVFDDRGCTVTVVAAWRFEAPTRLNPFSPVPYPFVLDQEDYVDPTTGAPFLVLTWSTTEFQWSDNTQIFVLSAEPDALHPRNGLAVPAVGGTPTVVRPASTTKVTSALGRLIDAEPVHLRNALGRLAVHLFYRQEIDQSYLNLAVQHPQAAQAVAHSDIATPIEILHHTTT